MKNDKDLEKRILISDYILDYYDKRSILTQEIYKIKEQKKREVEKIKEQIKVLEEDYTNFMKEAKIFNRIDE